MPDSLDRLLAAGQDSSMNRPKLVLALSSAALLLLAVVMLVSLYGDAEDVQPDERSQRTERVVRRTTDRSPARRRARLPQQVRRDEAPAAPASAPAGATDEPRDPRPDQLTHSAPAAVPSSIKQETDPVKRARLERMHALATARARASQLRRRFQLLSRTIARARRDKSWPPERIRAAEQDLEQVREAVEQAQRNVELAAKRVAEDDQAAEAENKATR
jgi:hypothetical protein